MLGSIIITGGAAVYPPLATVSTNGILKLATNAQGIAGTNNAAAMTPAADAAAMAAAVGVSIQAYDANTAKLNAVGAYTKQQYATAVARTGASGSQAVDMDDHQLLTIVATGAIALAAPAHMVVGKSMAIQIYADTAVGITYNAAYCPSKSFVLPTNALAGKWTILCFYCHKAGSVLLTGMVQES